MDEIAKETMFRTESRLPMLAPKNEIWNIRKISKQINPNGPTSLLGCCQASTHHQAWIGTWGHRLADSCALAVGLHQPGGVPWVTENAPPPPPPPQPYTLNHFNLGTRSSTRKTDPITKVLRIPSRGTAPKHFAPDQTWKTSHHSELLPRLQNLPISAAPWCTTRRRTESLHCRSQSQRLQYCAATGEPMPHERKCIYELSLTRKLCHQILQLAAPAYLSKAHSSHQQGHEDQHQGNLSFVFKQLRASWGSLASL